MKKIFVLPLILLFAAVLSASEYKFTALGDTHYDGAQYHTSPPAKSYQKRERQRNYSMWSDGRSDAVLAAAAKKTTPEMRFVVQLGDITQGDCDTSELFEKMFADAFAKIKSHFPDNKLLIVKGNHDVRQLNVEGKSNGPAAKALLPLIAKELGVEKVTGTYSVRQGKDLYIFFDAFLPKKQSLQSLKKVLADNPDTRYTFFITHLPVLNCCTGNPAWLVKDYKSVRDLLLERNAIIIAAHTHIPSLIQAKRNGKQLTQVVVTSVGKDWIPGSKPEINISGFDKYCQKVGLKRIASKRFKPSFDDMKSFELPVFEILKHKTCVGFAKLKISDAGVDIEYYTNAGKPAMVKKLR